jgi:hypothetical protein
MNTPGKQRNQWPCTGVTKQYKSKIVTYLLQTAVSSAGGKSIVTLAKKHYNKTFRACSKEEQDTIQLLQKATH